MKPQPKLPPLARRERLLEAALALPVAAGITAQSLSAMSDTRCSQIFGDLKGLLA